MGDMNGGGQPQMNPNQQMAAQYGQGSRAFYAPFNSPYSGPRQPGSYDQMPPQGNPSVGLSAVIQQMSQGLSPIAARQQLAGVAGVPQRGPGIGSAQPQFQGSRPFSPVGQEGYQSQGGGGMPK